MPKPLRLSPLHFAPNAIFLHRILSRMHFLCMYFADTFTLFSIVFCLKCLFSILFPQKKTPVYFAQIFKFVSIVSYPKCNCSPFYFAQNAFFVYVFCHNLYAFSIVHCTVPQMQFFSIVFCHAICNYESEAPAARMWCGQD